MEYKVFLNTIEKVKEFSTVCSNYPSLTIDVLSGRYIVNAKSLMGLFSLDLTHYLTIRTDVENKRFAKDIERFIVDV